MYERGLAYRKNAPTNWCPKDQTVLANEQVVNGVCERCGTAVIQKDLEQWFFRSATTLTNSWSTTARPGRPHHHNAA